MIFLSKSRTNGNFTVWLNRLFSLLAILVCLNSLAVAQGGSTPVTVNVSMSPPSFLYRDGSWVSIHVSCNSACGNVNTWIDDTYGWGFATLDSNGDANGANTIYVPSSILTPGQHKLTVNYEGNSTYAAASGSTNFTVQALGTTPTITTVSMSSTSFSAAVGAWAYIHVDCNSACGSVDAKIDDFDWGTNTLDPSGNNDGGYTTYIPITYQNPGPHHLTVYYLGNTVYAPSVSAQYDFTILGPSAAGTIYSSSVSYAANGNVSAYTDSVNGIWPSFSYDGVNRLTSATQEVNKQDQYLCWTYDSFGNRTSQTPSSTPCGSSVSTVQYPNNQIPGLGYDPGGNVSNDGTNQYLYDAEGRICAVRYPLQIGPPGAMAQYIYDAEGRRVAKGTITSWSCDTGSNGFNETNGFMIGPEGEQLTEVDGQGNWVHTNVFASGRLIATYDPQNIHFHFLDWLGIRRVQTDYAGNIESTYQSLPFGETVPQYQGLGATEHFFTGKERDAESGLDYFGARHYSSTMGRFMSPDPSGLYFADPTNPQSLNLYSYVLNNPLVNTDPDGLRCVWDDGSFDSEDDKDTGSKAQCEGGTKGGTWHDPGTYSRGTDWASSNSDGTLTLHVDATRQSAVTRGVGLVADTTIWYGGYIADIGLLYVNGANKITGDPQVPYNRFFMTHYCGPGGAGNPNGTLDKACKIHDACFDDAGLDASVNVGTSGSSLSPEQVAAATKCNQGLYNAARSNPRARGSSSLQLWLTEGSKTTPFGGYVLYPGTEAKPW